MRERNRLNKFAALAVVGLALGAADVAIAEEAQTQTSAPEVFKARVFRPGGRANAMSTVTFTVNRWTSLDEREQLLEILHGKGKDALSSALRKLDVGFARDPDNPGWRLNYALSLDTQQGRMIRLVAERPLVLGELARTDKKNMNARSSRSPRST